MAAVLKPVQKVFGGLLGGSTPTPQVAPATPTMGSDAVQRAAEEEARRRSNAGRASTIFAGETDTAPAASKIFLGAGS